MTVPELASQIATLVDGVRRMPYSRELAQVLLKLQEAALWLHALHTKETTS